MKNRIKKIFRSFSSRVTLIFVVLMLICAILWTQVFYLNIQNNAIENVISDERAYLDKLEQNINNIEEVVNMTIQMVPSMNSIINHVEDTVNGVQFTAAEKISFKNNELKSLENISNINPYLYNVRLFVNAPSVTNIMPCFYDFNHMYNLSWAEDREDYKWIVDYQDTVHPDSVGNTHLVGKTVAKTDSITKEQLYVLEISTQMSNLFPDIYTSEKYKSAYFVDSQGEFHCNDNETVSDERKEIINKYISECSEKIGVYNTTLEQKKVVISLLKLDSFDGWYIHLSDVDYLLVNYYDNQNTYFWFVIFSLLICLILVFLITTKMFKRFNIIQDSIVKIEQGQTDLRIKIRGKDEISDMAKHINSMLDRLQMLNVENTTRQLIVKNTEIKAMQNQINAHFMYNVLESIKMMAEIQGQYEISDAVTSLGQMFRYSVKWTSGKVAISEEIDHIKNYLSLMNIRLENDVSLSISIPDELLSHKIPKMALQPIIENAILHGVEGIGHASTISIKAYVDNDIFNVEITDTGRGMKEEELLSIRDKLKGGIKLDESTTHGLALKNVQNRIKMYYGEEYGLEIFSELNKFTKIILHMPYENKGTQN